LFRYYFLPKSSFFSCETRLPVIVSVFFHMSRKSFSKIVLQSMWWPNTTR
jgi:hypothetical protein